MKTWKHCVAAVLFLGVAQLSIAEAPRRDGNWWLGESDATVRATYILGFFDGVVLGRNFSGWALIFDNRADCWKELSESFGKWEKTYLANVTAGQLADGLDLFYKEPSNRRIRVHNAVWLVLQGFSGKPQDELNKMIENARKEAAND